MKLNLHQSYTFKEGLLAYIDYRKHKRQTWTQQVFEVNYEHTIENLIQSINDESYTIGSSTIFVVTEPKIRIVIAAKPIDRVVHHLICRDLMAPWEKTFIVDSCACIKGRGTLYASERLRQHINTCSQGYSQPAYYASVDIKNFFVSISKPLLWEFLAEHLTDGENLTSRITKKIVFNDPRINPTFRPGTDLSIVPPHKNLFNQDDDHGLPIGNITSQFFANVYLDKLDKYVKHQLKIKHYVRYVDDAILIDKDKSRLAETVAAMDEFLKTRLQLQLHPDKIRIAPVTSGINFVGRIIHPYRVYCRQGLYAKTRLAAKALQKYPFDYNNLCSLNSYLGLLCQADSYNFRKQICQQVTIPHLLLCSKDYSKVFF